MISYIFCDVDGILTDGGYIVDHQGNISKRFHTRDIDCLSRLVKKGYKVFCITSSNDNCTIKKMETVGIYLIYNCLDKNDYIEEYFINKSLCSWDNILFIGDGINDLKCMSKCKIKSCPKDASKFILNMEDILISDVCGGHGCVEDIVYRLSDDLRILIND